MFKAELILLAGLIPMMIR